MEKWIWQKATNPSFWQHYARWYQQWLEHTSYHRKIVEFLVALAKPAWRVLDIGAGSGVASLPLAKRGCYVTALEPCEAMREQLCRNLGRAGMEGIQFDERSWEEVPVGTHSEYDLLVACNSLHLTSTGFSRALGKVFEHHPKWVVAVAELLSPDIQVPLLRGRYALQYAAVEKTDTSFVYHDDEEVWEHWSVLKGRRPRACEKTYMAGRLQRFEGHLRMNDEAHVGIFCWRKLEDSACWK